MAHRELELTLLSARDLKNVNLFLPMDVYAVATISGDPMTRQCTPTDKTGGRNPSWNTTFRFSVPANAAAAGTGWVHVLLRSERTFGDRDVGEVIVPLAEILAGADGTGPLPLRLASYQVHTVHRGEPRGVLNVSYHLGPVVVPVENADDDKQQTFMGYPAPHQPFHHPQNPASEHPYYKPQNPAPPQPYQHQHQHHSPDEAYASPQTFKPQNPAGPQPYQYNHQHDSYASPRPLKPQSPAYQYPHEAYSSPQQFKPQNPKPYHYPDEAYAPPQQSKAQNPKPYHYPEKAYAPPQQSKTQNPKPYHYPDETYAPPQQSKTQTPKPQNSQPTKPQTPGSPSSYQYPDEAYSSPQQLKPQNPKPYHYPDEAYTSPQQSKTQNPKPQNPQPPKSQSPASPQSYQYPDEAYASSRPFKPPQNPATPQPYHYPDEAYSLKFKTQNPKTYHPPQDAYANYPPRDSYAPPTNGNGNGHGGTTQVYMGPHTQIIFGAAPPISPQSNNTIPTKTTQEPRPKTSYTPTQPNASPVKTDYSWPKASPQETPTWPNAIPKKPDRSNSTKPQHDTKVVEHFEKTKVVEHAPKPKPSYTPTQTHTSPPVKVDNSLPKPSPQHQDTSTWPNASPKKPDRSNSTKPQHDSKVVEHVYTQSKIGSDQSRPQAVAEQKNTQVANISASKKINETQAGDYARTQSNIQPGKADSKPKEAYANNRSNSMPGKAADNQSGLKAVLQHERVLSFPATAAR